MATPPSPIPPQQFLAKQVRWHPLEIVFWIATLLPFYFFPSYLSLASQIAIAALFALSLDLILGYAGIVSLGHAAFFGVGAYAAGLFSKFVWGEPFSGLVVAAVLAGVVVTMSSGYQDEISFLGRGLGQVAPYVVMVLVLLWRPAGLFGTKELTRV